MYAELLMVGHTQLQHMAKHTYPQWLKPLHQAITPITEHPTLDKI